MGAYHDSVVKIVKADGSIGSENKKSATVWGNTPSYIPYGSSIDLWSESWTQADINDADFGIVLSVSNPGQGSYPDAPTPSVDHIRITVYYTASAPTNTGNMLLVF